MTDAFKESAVRHWSDATLLENAKRHDNANQLVGFAAECAIKTALCQLKGFTDKDGQLEGLRIHIDKLWDRITPQGIQKRFPTLYALLKAPNPFHDWSIDHRYARDGTVSRDASCRHRDMARRLLGSVGINGKRAGS
jgi:hypothetical protein